MPAISKAQRRFFGFVEHHPEQAKVEGVYPSGMTHDQMHDFAATSEQRLPQKARPPRRRRYYGEVSDGS